MAKYLSPGVYVKEVDISNIYPLGDPKVIKLMQTVDDSINSAVIVSDLNNKFTMYVSSKCTIDNILKIIDKLEKMVKNGL